MTKKKTKKKSVGRPTRPGELVKITVRLSPAANARLRKVHEDAPPDETLGDVASRMILAYGAEDTLDELLVRLDDDAKKLDAIRRISNS
jgi:hypothetical protein